MVDLISTNKQIFQQTRRAVREDVELDEAVLDTADYKIGPSGRKVRAHRIKVGDEVKEEFEIEEATDEIPDDPPFVLMLKRKAIRMYPNKTKVALYYNQKLDKYFTIPYGKGVDSPLQAEETQIEEAVMDQLHKIVAGKQANTVKFANGQTKKLTTILHLQLHKFIKQ